MVDNVSGEGVTVAWLSPVGAAEDGLNTGLRFSTSGNRIDLNLEGFVEGDTGLLVNGSALWGLEFSFEASAFGFGSAVDGQTPFGYLGLYVGSPYSSSGDSYLFL